MLKFKLRLIVDSYRLVIFWKKFPRTVFFIFKIILRCQKSRKILILKRILISSFFRRNMVEIVWISLETWTGSRSGQYLTRIVRRKAISRGNFVQRMASNIYIYIYLAWTFYQLFAEQSLFWRDREEPKRRRLDGAPRKKEVVRGK